MGYYPKILITRKGAWGKYVIYRCRGTIYFKCFLSEDIHCKTMESKDCSRNPLFSCFFFFHIVMPSIDYGRSDGLLA